ncbi:kelch-like protein 5 isoform X1 [Tachysurus ichikawai]
MSVPGRKDFDVKQILRIRWRWFGHAMSPPLVEELLSRTGDLHRHHQHNRPHALGSLDAASANSASAHVNSPVSVNRNKLSASACALPPPLPPPPPPHRSTSQQECGSTAFTSPSHSRSASDVTCEGTEQRNGTTGEDAENNNTTKGESESSSCRTSNSSATLSSCVSMEPCVPDELFQSHSHAEHTFKRMETYLRTRKLCDVVLVAGDRKIPAHR